MTKPNEKLVELRRHLKVARRTAVNARTSARITLKQIVVTAPPALRETLHPLADQALLNRCRGWRCGTIDTPTASAKHTLRALARRWFARSVEIVDHDRHLSRLTTSGMHPQPGPGCARVRRRRPAPSLRVPRSRAGSYRWPVREPRRTGGRCPATAAPGHAPVPGGRAPLRGAASYEAEG